MEHPSRTTENVAVGVGYLGKRNLVPMQFGGHCYYVRKCVTGDHKEGDGFMDRTVGGIYLPQSAAERSVVVQVLAKGPKVGKPCSEKHMKLHGRSVCVEDDVSVGDLLVCPDDHQNPGVLRNPECPYEFYIEESVPLYALERESDE